MAITKVDIARRLNVSKALITRYTGRGMPVSSFEAAEQWYRANVNQRVNQSSPPIPNGTDPGEAGPSSLGRREPFSMGGDLVPDYQESRARREAAEAELAEIKVRQQMGVLIEAAGVKAEYAKQVASVRDGLLNIPARLAPVVIACKSEREAQTVLDTEIRAVLAQFVGEA